MKNSMMIVAAGLLLASTSAMATAKLPVVQLQGKVPTGLKAAQASNAAMYVKRGQQVERAQQLTKGDQLVNLAGQPLAVVTGKLVVKLKANADVSLLAANHGLRVDWTGPAQLVLVTPTSDVELLSLLEQLRNDPLVERAKLDKAEDKQKPM